MKLKAKHVRLALLGHADGSVTVTTVSVDGGARMLPAHLRAGETFTALSKVSCCVENGSSDIESEFATLEVVLEAAAPPQVADKDAESAAEGDDADYDDPYEDAYENESYDDSREDAA